MLLQIGFEVQERILLGVEKVSNSSCRSSETTRERNAGCGVELVKLKGGTVHQLMARVDNRAPLRLILILTRDAELA